MICKICNKEVNFKSMKKHLKKHNLDIYSYGKKYSLFYSIIINDKVYLNSFNNICKLCESEFIMVFDCNGDIKVKNCTNCSNHSFSKKIYSILSGIEAQEIINKYNEKIINTRASYNNYVKKYGIIEGEKKYKKWVSQTNGSVTSFIKRYGKEEGEKRYDEFRKKCSNSKENYIKKYGEKEGIERYNKNVESHSKSSPRTLNYWVKKTDNYFDAVKKLNDFQKRDKEFFIKKYGENGEKVFDEINIKKIKNSSYDYYIKKYGKEEGHKIFLNKLIRKNGRKSKISQEFKNLLSLKIDFEIQEEKQILIEEELKIFFVDFIIPEKNVVIEFYGDYWHANPKFYKREDMIKSKKASQIWEEDKERISLIKSKLNCKVLTIWEDDFKKDKFKIIEDLDKKLKEIQ